MTNKRLLTNKHTWRHRYISLFFMGLCLFFILLFTGTTSQAEGAVFLSHEGCRTARLAGKDRYETCSQIAQEACPEGPAEIVIATGEKFPDALAASSFSGALKSPILLSKRDYLPKSIRALIKDTWQGSPQKAYIIGSGFSKEVKNALYECGIKKIEVIAGRNRYETAEKLCQKELAEGLCSDTCIIATGEVPADAMSVSPWAYRNKMPILLAKNGRLSTTSKNLAACFSNVIIVGSESCCRTSEIAALKITPVRLAGANRYETSYKIASYFTAEQEIPFLTLAAGADSHFPDALCGATLSGSLGSPVLLTKDDRANQPVYRFINERAAGQDNVTSIYTLGGKPAVSSITEKTVIGLFSSSPVWVITNYADKSGMQGMFYTVVNEKTGYLIVIDGGWAENETQVRKVLKKYGSHVSAWIITHYHNDHVDSFNRIIAKPKEIAVDKIFAPAFDYRKYVSVAKTWDRPESFKAFLDRVPKDRLEYVTRGSRYDMDGLAVTFFNTYDEQLLATEKGDLPNNGSLVFKMSAGEKDILFCGDCYSPKIGKLMIEEFGEELKAEYVQAGHHGNSSFPTSFYDFIEPKTMIFDAPKWLMTGEKYTAKDLKKHCVNAGIEVIDFSTAPNEILFFSE